MDKMIYPNGTRFYNTSFEKRFKTTVEWWELEGYANNGKMKIFDNFGRHVEFAPGIMKPFSGWRIEYPKEDLFDQLYKRLK